MEFQGYKRQNDNISRLACAEDNKSIPFSSLKLQPAI
jgi:hypothetical protein